MTESLPPSTPGYREPSAHFASRAVATLRCRDTATPLVTATRDAPRMFVKPSSGQ